MVVMAAGCLYCARELWTRGTLRSWTLVALMNLAMIALHLPMASHHHAGGVTAAPADSTAMTLATVLAVIEVVVAAAVLFRHTRGLAPS